MIKLVMSNRIFFDKWTITWSLFFKDYDNDCIKEIFVFTLHEDSIYLNCLYAIHRKIELENKTVY